MSEPVLVFQIWYKHESDYGDGWRDYHDVYEDGIAYSTRDKAQEVADQLNAQEDVYHKQRWESKKKKYALDQAEHHILYVAGLRKSPTLDEDPGPFIPSDKYYVEPMEVL